MEFETGRSPAIQFTQRQRWSLILSYLLLAAGLLAGINLRDSALNRVSVYSNAEAGITAQYPARWLLEESGDYVFRVRDMSRRGFNTQIAVDAVAVGADSSARSLFDQLSLARAQALIDYAALGYDDYALTDGSSAISMAYSYVARDANPFLQGLSTIVRGLDILIARRGQAILVSFLADNQVYERELATLERFVDNLEF